MDGERIFTFDVDVRHVDRNALLGEAERQIAKLDYDLGPEVVPGSGDRAASRLLDDLRREIAGFGDFPDVVAFDQEGFKKYGWTVPGNFSALSEFYQFYLVRFPVILSPTEGAPFNKLECAVEFNPGAAAGHRRPRALLILPDRRFKDLTNLNASVEVEVSGNVDVGAATPEINLQYGEAKLKAAVGADLGADAQVNFTVGPFGFRMRRAEVEHSPAGSEKVFWRLSGTRFTREDDPAFIVVLQVPRSVGAVQVAAALQAYHRPEFGLPIDRAIRSLTDLVASFFRSGAPISSIKSWDNILSPNP